MRARPRSRRLLSGVVVAAMTAGLFTLAAAPAQAKGAGTPLYPGEIFYAPPTPVSYSADTPGCTGEATPMEGYQSDVDGLSVYTVEEGMSGVRDVYGGCAIVYAPFEVPLEAHMVGSRTAGSTVRATTNDFQPSTAALTYTWTFYDYDTDDQTVISTSSTVTYESRFSSGSLILVITALQGKQYSEARTNQIEAPTFSDFAAAYTGDAKVGATVTAVDPVDLPQGTTFDHVWTVGDKPVGDQSTYAVQPADAGQSLTLTTTAKAPGYDDRSVTSAPVTVSKGSKQHGAPTISDTTPKVGQALTASGPSVPEGAGVAYFWGTASVGSTTCAPSTTAAASYTPKAADLGKSVCVVAKVTGVTGYEDSSSVPAFTSRVRETAKVALSDYTIKRGQKFTIYGFDLAPSKKYSIEVYGIKLTGTAGANGRIARAYTYPTTAGSSKRKVAVVQTSGGVTTYRKTALLTYTR